MKVRVERPAGNRILGAALKRTEKAIQFEYHGWVLWIPKKAVTKVRGGPYTAPMWAVDSAKEHPSAERLEAAE